MIKTGKLTLDHQLHVEVSALQKICGRKKGGYTESDESFTKRKDDTNMTQIYIYIYIYLCGITVFHKRVLNCHIYRWKEQNNYAGEK